MVRAVEGLGVIPDEILIDGNRVPAGLSAPARAIVGGDGREACIGAASIIAKTLRDQIMIEAENRFSGYGLAGHKGYPSPSHKAALEKTRRLSDRKEEYIEPVRLTSSGPSVPLPMDTVPICL